jgi:alcohol dehydrogenase
VPIRPGRGCPAWIRDVLITTGLVDTSTTPKLLKLIADGRLDPTPFATHRFELGETEEAYDTFAHAAATNALKVVLGGKTVQPEPARLAAVTADGS